jgi:hypothetical protein
MSKPTIARAAAPNVSPNPDTIADVGNNLDSIARRLRTIAEALDGDVGEAVACVHEYGDVYPYFEVMLDAIRAEAARLEKHSEQLFAYRKAVA